jgi:hypothetical protein
MMIIGLIRGQGKELFLIRELTERPESALPHALIRTQPVRDQPAKDLKFEISLVVRRLNLMANSTIWVRPLLSN